MRVKLVQLFAGAVVCAGFVPSVVCYAEPARSEISVAYGQGSVDMSIGVNDGRKQTTYQQEILGLNMLHDFADHWYNQLTLRDINASADEYVQNGGLWRVTEHEQQEVNIMLGRYFALPDSFGLHSMAYFSGGGRYTDYSATFAKISSSGTPSYYLMEDQKIGFIWQAGLQAELTARYQTHLSPYVRRYEGLNKPEKEWGLSLDMQPVPALKLGLAYESSLTRTSDALLLELSAVFSH